MAYDRQYGEEEVREIFERAAEERDSEGRTPDPGKGLTLAELQAIGTEVGLSPARIADAATAVDLRRDASPRRTSLGMPITVERVVPLPRALTDREWGLLVSELRQTFRATGRLDESGGVRHWNNGNLHAYVEPSQSGYRLRMSTLKGNAQIRTLMGLGGLGVAALLALILILDGGVWRELIGPLMIALMGGVALGTNILGLPGWAREREAQMEQVATKTLAMLLSGPADDSAEQDYETGPPEST